MILVVLCGYPACGKSLVSSALAKRYIENGMKVEIVSDGEVEARPIKLEDFSKDARLEVHENCRQDQKRASMYRDSTAEKATRARMKAAADRALAPGTVVLLDSLNYIKGFRYELFCVAKTAGARYCVVHVETPAATCQQTDANREDAYGKDLCDALFQRFEVPHMRNRWDSPLHSVSPLGGPEAHLPGSRAPTRDEWESVVSSIVESSLSKSAPLKTSFATQTRQAQSADVLGVLDRVTRVAESAVLSALQSGAGAGDRLQVPGGSHPLLLTRRCKVTELRGMRRAHLSLARLCPPKTTSEQALVDGYIDYVSSQLSGGTQGH